MFATKAQGPEFDLQHSHTKQDIVAQIRNPSTEEAGTGRSLGAHWVVSCLTWPVRDHDFRHKVHGSWGVTPKTSGLHTQAYRSTHEHMCTHMHRHIYLLIHGKIFNFKGLCVSLGRPHELCVLTRCTYQSPMGSRGLFLSQLPVPGESVLTGRDCSAWHVVLSSTKLSLLGLTGSLPSRSAPKIIYFSIFK